MLAHHGGVAAEAVTGQDQRIAADGFTRAVRSFADHGRDPALAVMPQLARQCARQHQRARVRRRLSQRGHQRLARALAQRVHAAGAMTGVQEAVQQLEAQPGLFQRVDGGRRGPGIGLHQMRGGGAAGLGQDVGGEVVHAVRHAGGALHARTRRRNEAGRQRGGPGRHGVTLDHHAFHARPRQPDGGGQAAGAAADDEHGQRQFRRGLRVRSVHRTIPAMKSSQARRSATLRRSASAASCNAGVGAAQPSASTVTW